MYIYHGRSCLRDRGAARPPWRTKILILHIFLRNKLGLEEQGLLIAAPPERGCPLRLWRFSHTFMIASLHNLCLLWSKAFNWRSNVLLTLKVLLWSRLYEALIKHESFKMYCWSDSNPLQYWRIFYIQWSRKHLVRQPRSVGYVIAFIALYLSRLAWNPWCIHWRLRIIFYQISTSLCGWRKTPLFARFNISHGQKLKNWLSAI